jgi:hypothetical protein
VDDGPPQENALDSAERLSRRERQPTCDVGMTHQIDTASIHDCFGQDAFNRHFEHQPWGGFVGRRGAVVVARDTTSKRLTGGKREGHAGSFVISTSGVASTWAASASKEGAAARK